MKSLYSKPYVSSNLFDASRTKTIILTFLDEIPSTNAKFMIDITHYHLAIVFIFFVVGHIYIKLTSNCFLNGFVMHLIKLRSVLTITTSMKNN